MRKRILILILLPSLLFGRVWTNTEGQSFEGLHIFHDKTFVHIQRDYDRKTFTVERSSLIESDNLYLDSISSRDNTAGFLKNHITSFSEGAKASIERKMPMYLIYRHKMTVDEFARHMESFIMNPETEKKLDGRAFLVIVVKEDHELSSRIATQLVDNDSAFGFFLGDQWYIAGGFPGLPRSEKPLEYFLAKLEENLTRIEDISAKSINPYGDSLIEHHNKH
jgi:hypothetical protein